MEEVSHMRANLIGLVASVALVAALLPGSASEAIQSSNGSIDARVQALEDREAIRALFALYGRTLDARDFAAFEQLWARDAEFVGGAGVSAKGPAAIRALLESLLKQNAAPVSGRDFHLFANETIDVKGNEATALSKGAFLVRGQNNRLEVSILANYHDLLVREDRTWKFKRRQIGDSPGPAAPAASR
jgi:uncharacterized protein (TIGR02246 family)